MSIVTATDSFVSAPIKLAAQIRRLKQLGGCRQQVGQRSELIMENQLSKGTRRRAHETSNVAAAAPAAHHQQERWPLARQQSRRELQVEQPATQATTTPTTTDTLAANTHCQNHKSPPPQLNYRRHLLLPLYCASMLMIVVSLIVGLMSPVCASQVAASSRQQHHHHSHNQPNHHHHQQQQQQQQHLHKVPVLPRSNNNNNIYNYNPQTKQATNDLDDMQLLRHHAHYINIVPSTHFQYNEGRSYSSGAQEEAPLNAMDAPTQSNDIYNNQAQQVSAKDSYRVAKSAGSSPSSESPGPFAPPAAGAAGAAAAPQAAPVSNSHIYKRSSAALVAPAHSNSLDQLARYAPLVSSYRSPTGPQASGALISRRMMSAAAAAAAAAASSSGANQHQFEPISDQLAASSEIGGVRRTSAAQQVHGANNNKPANKLMINYQIISPSQEQQQRSHQHAMLATSGHDYDSELLRQKQHIQYHDQWPVSGQVGAKCHKRTLNFCASVLPFNSTTFPNIIGDTNRFEVKRSLPFFGFLAKSSCNRRLDELLCLLLEPPCQKSSGRAIPPCKKFCRLALEGCNEYIPATLALSSVFDCRQYPDSNDPAVCVNLARGSKCSQDEFKCPDRTCIPRNWLCDGVRDCIFAADEANCTAPAQPSVCSTEEFKCDGKCVPKAWKCDGERDCLDGSDERSCDLRPKCGPDRFRCSDGNGCIPKRWVCDGKAECRDGSDEMNCEQRDCSENDFKCGNGICIPKLWRCDRQFDCKDGSDEHYCVYPTSSTTTKSPPTTTTTTTTSTTTTTIAPTTTTGAAAADTSTPTQVQTTPPVAPSSESDLLRAVNSSYEIHEADTEQQQQQQQQQQQPQQQSINRHHHHQVALGGDNGQAAANYYATASTAPVVGQQQHHHHQSFETNLGDDVTRIIKQPPLAIQYNNQN